MALPHAGVLPTLTVHPSGPASFREYVMAFDVMIDK
jgi:hypothetical protein